MSKSEMPQNSSCSYYENFKVNITGELLIR